MYDATGGSARAVAAVKSRARAINQRCTAGSSSQQLIDQLAVVGDFHGPAFLRVELIIRIDAEQAVQGGRQVFRAIRIGGGPFGPCIARADGASTVDSTAADGNGERGTPMV